MIGVWAGLTRWIWLFISNDRQFAHLSAHGAQYAPTLPSFLPVSARYYSLPPPLHHYACTSPFQQSSAFTFLPLPRLLPNGAISPYWGHRPGSSRKSAAGCRLMRLYGAESKSPGTGRRMHLRRFVRWLSAVWTDTQTVWDVRANIKTSDKRWKSVWKGPRAHNYKPPKENDSRSCPSAVSSRVHAHIQMTGHFPASSWNTKTTVNPLAARSSAKIRFTPFQQHLLFSSRLSPNSISVTSL